MALTKDAIDAFFRGDDLPDEVLQEIDRALDDPTSEVSQLCREYARITRLMFDPQGPTFGPTDSEVKELLSIDIRASSALVKEGQFDDALALRRDVYERTRQRFGERDRDTLTSLNSLAKLLFETDNFAESRATYEQAVKLRSELLGDMHGDVAISLTGLGRVLEALGEYPAAVAVHRRATAISEVQLGRESPDTGVSLNDLGCALQTVGEAAEARDCFQRALNISRQFDGENHPNTAIVLGNLAGALEALGNWQSAQDAYLQALAVFESVPDRGDNLVWLLNNLGSLLHLTGDDTSSVLHLERALSFEAGPRRSDQIGRASILNNLATTQHAVGNLESARQHWQQSLVLFREAFGEDHPTTQAVRLNLAALPSDDLASATSQERHDPSALKAAIGASYPFLLGRTVWYLPWEGHSHSLLLSQAA